MYYSQCNQDKYLEETVFKGYKNGTFVDVGAHNGVSLNNTLFFERMHNWTGINIEPLPNVYQDLVKNRPQCVNLNCAVSSQNGTAEFLQASVESEMLSGLKNCYDPRHVQRIKRETIASRGKCTTITVSTRRLDSIFKEHSISHVNYLSIDVEGAEFEVIKSIDFDAVFIDVIGFENNYNDKSQPIVDYLSSKGYLMLKRYTDIFMIHNQSKFNASAPL
jgi:FkbM family methyltransferase